MKKFKNILSLLPLFKPYRREVFFAFLALIITTLMVLFFGKALKYLIDLGFAEKNHLSLNIVLLIFSGAVLVMAIAGFYRSSLINSAAEKAISDLRKKVYDHIIRVSAEFFEINKTGEVISRLTVDTVLLYTILSSTISFLLRNALLFLGGICFLFLTSFKLSVISLLLILVAISPIILMGRRVKNLSKESQSALGAVGAHVEESINGVKTIQSYLCEEKEARNFFGFVDEALKVSLKRIRIKSLMIAYVITLAFGAIAVILWVGGHDVLLGKITSGDLSSFIFYSIISATSLVSLSQIAGQLQSASSAAERIFELLQIESPVKEIENPQPFLGSEKVTLKFNSVNFSYPSRKDFLVLKNFNLEIKPGQKIAIVGLSGSGKSTLLQLLLRFYDVDSGAITANDRDIKSLSFKDLRQNFSYISQDCFIFSGTIFENIAYVDNSTLEAEVEKMISQNPALEFINKLPKKLHTSVGEKGIKLSGGERQRIAFARALIKNSPILLLDEATSALDNQNEQSINRSILELARDKTVITVAHRLSSIVNSEKIIFLEGGEIVESGTHQELMEMGGSYRKMYEMEEVAGGLHHQG
ncbi:MAG: ATP-binding cassette domain-containing protein [Proteobacteria bacterium]|nr:ATP-binding cassette domain-containing protein [Pseudomonadota bacterium]